MSERGNLKCFPFTSDWSNEEFQQYIEEQRQQSTSSEVIVYGGCEDKPYSYLAYGFYQITLQLNV